MNKSILKFTHKTQKFLATLIHTLSFKAPAMKCVIKFFDTAAVGNSFSFYSTHSSAAACLSERKQSV